MELCDEGDVNGSIRRIKRRGEDGGEGCQTGSNKRQSEYVKRHHQVGDKKKRDNDVPGPDWKEGGYQAKADRSEGAEKKDCNYVETCKKCAEERRVLL